MHDHTPASVEEAPAGPRWLLVYLVFVASGFAALLYQVVWQRVLFSIYGINIESVTVVVTAFMLGLGFGSLAGGALSRDPRRRVLRWFAVVEAGIGVFGLLSLDLFRVVGQATLDRSPWVTGALTFALLLLPTLLMGATLPLLVAHLVRRSGNVGQSVGTLYFVNTLGAALASTAAVTHFLPHLALTGTVRAAAALNLLAAGVVAFHDLRARPLSLQGSTP